MAQHREIHTLLGSVVSPRKGFQNHPVTRLYNNEHLVCLVDYHTYTLREMSRRGWSGHKTIVKPEVLELALSKLAPSSCRTWESHVEDIVDKYGQYSVDGDVHDLVTRWSNEQKLLRNNVAEEYVLNHTLTCVDPHCQYLSAHLINEYQDRREQQWANPLQLMPTKGNSSLKGQLETIGVN